MKLLKKLIPLAAVFILLFSLSSCKEREHLKLLGNDYEINIVKYSIYDEDNTIVTASNKQSSYSLLDNKMYYLELATTIDVADVLDEKINLRVLFSDAIGIPQVEEANTSVISTSESSIDFGYICSSSQIGCKFTIRFIPTKTINNLSECINVYAKSSSVVFVNNSKDFTYLLPDYFSNTMHVETDMVYSYVYYGTAPQSHVSDIETIKKLNRILEANKRGYLELDGVEYVRISASKGETRYYSDGTQVEDGWAYFKVEPIVWRVLNVNKSKYTLLSEYAIDFAAIEESYNVDDYFTSQEIKNIRYEKVAPTDYATIQNAGYGFSSDAKRVCIATDYTLAKAGYSVDASNNTIDWGVYSSKKMKGVVSTKGYAQEMDETSSNFNTSYGVRISITMANNGYVYRNNVTASWVSALVILGGALVLSLVFYFIYKYYWRYGWVSFPVNMILLVAYIPLFFFTPLNYWLILICLSGMVVVDGIASLFVRNAYNQQ